MGDMSDSDYLSVRISDEETHGKCRCCGVDGLTWGQHEGEWRLFEDGEIHKCQVHPLWR